MFSVDLPAYKVEYTNFSCIRNVSQYFSAISPPNRKGGVGHELLDRFVFQSFSIALGDRAWLLL